MAVKAGAAFNVPEGFRFSPSVSVSSDKKARFGTPCQWCHPLQLAESSSSATSQRFDDPSPGSFPDQHLRALMKATRQTLRESLRTDRNQRCAYYEVEPLSPEQTAPSDRQACANTNLIALTPRERGPGPGEEGLLYARGSTVMQGYYGRPEILRSFIPNPFAAGREEKLYCPGIGSRSREGNYLFVGRKVT